MRTFIHAVILLLLLFPIVVKAQEGSFEMILTPGDSAKKAGNMVAAVDFYKASIYSGKGASAAKGTIDRVIYEADLYNLSTTLSRLGQQDSAVIYLTRFVVESKDSVGEALSDPEFYKIRSAAGWAKLENLILKSYIPKNKLVIKDLAYAKKLWELRAIDQAYYQDIALAERTTGKSSPVTLAIWELKKKLGEENLRTLEALIAKKGWPKISEVSNGPASTAFLVIQHATLEKQQQYLPVIKKLCVVREARWQDYALMYDRIQTDIDKPQRYGSQVRYNNETGQHELFPLENAAKVDEWRKEVGLNPLSEYLANWKIAWPPTK